MNARKVTIGVVAAVAVGGATAVAVVAGLPEARGGSAPSAAMPPATAAVTRETLVDRKDADGTLGYGESTALATRLDGTVTALPPVGKTLVRGASLYRVDDDPVVLLYGSLPAYRRLAPGVSGTDVKQFERNLWALGFRGFTVDREFTSATADAVREWQDDLGLDETGVVEPARIVYAAGPVRVDSRSAEPGAASRPGGELLSVTGTARVVTVELEVADQRLAKTGAAVRVTLPDGTGVPGRITAAESVVRPGEQGREDTTTIEVTVGFTGRVKPAGLDGAAVTVGFTAAQRKNVLTVPVAALLALAEGGYGVQVVDGGTTRILAVETGLFANGRVEVSGGGIAEGATVGMPA